MPLLKETYECLLTNKLKAFQLAPPAPSSGCRCIKQILVTFPLLLSFFCSCRQPLMCFATLCKWWLPPPPTSSLLCFSQDSWVWPEYVHVFSFLSFHPQESCSCWTRRPSLNTVEARLFFLRLFIIMSPSGSAQDRPHRRSNATGNTTNTSDAPSILLSGTQIMMWLSHQK